MKDPGILKFLRAVFLLFAAASISGCMVSADNIEKPDFSDYYTDETDTGDDSATTSDANTDDTDTEPDSSSVSESETEATESASDSNDPESTDDTMPPDTGTETDTETGTEDTDSVSDSGTDDSDTDEDTGEDTGEDTADDTGEDTGEDTADDTGEDTEPVQVVFDDDDGWCMPDYTIYNEAHYKVYFESVNSGYSGLGYLNPINTVYAFLEWSVDAVAPGPVDLEWVYAIGTGDIREATLEVNGDSGTPLRFESTGDWTTWKPLQARATLESGNNRIVLRPTTDSGLPNIDTLSITGVGMSIIPGTCD